MTSAASGHQGMATQVIKRLELKLCPFGENLNLSEATSDFNRITA